jgi:hypothetical protein
VMEVEATSIGPDLARCSASVLRRDAEPPGERDATRSQSADGERGQRHRWESGSRAEAAVGA